METILKLNKWANAHTHIGIDAMRVLLGAFLFYKGMFFFGPHATETYKLLDLFQGYAGNLITLHYIGMAHICGGIFIALGLLTRLSVLVQLPVLLTAVILNFAAGTYTLELLQAVLCFLAGAFFLIYGSGKHSVDYRMRMQM